MSELTFEELDDLEQRQGAGASIDRLIESFRDARDYHRLFDALLLKRRFEMGLSLVQPTSFDGIPDEHQEEFEDSYVDAAREVGDMFLADGNIAQAWMYFRTIREPEKVAEALNQVEARREPSEQTEELINVALYQGANPVKGLELLLRTHGTCNSITALDQQIHQMAPGDRRSSAALLVRELHNDLTYTVGREIEQKEGKAPTEKSLSALIKDRGWLFEEGNYHIDVSHLHSVVRFARFLQPGDRELSLAMELADYGTHLATQFQYPGDPPFENFYPAHVRYFQILADDRRDEAIAYFVDKLQAESDPQNKQMIAYVLVDLFGRIDRLDEALDLAAEHLRDVDESSGFSLARLCQQAGRLDALRDVARERRDFVGYLAARLEGDPRKSPNATPESPGASPCNDAQLPRSHIDGNPEMSYLNKNRATWDRMVQAGSRFCQPATDEECRNPLATLDSRGWLPKSVSGMRVLCLASGGGWQAILYAAAGAIVTVVDLSEAMLEIDGREAQKRGLSLTTLAASMDDLSMLAEADFDIVHQPVSTCYVADVAGVYREVARVLRDGGLYISQHKQPGSLQISHRDSQNRYVIGVEYYHAGPLPAVEDKSYREPGTVEYLHRWEQLVGDLCRSGFAIEDLCEPCRADLSAPAGHFRHRGRFVPPYIRMKARRLPRSQTPALQPVIWTP